MLQSFCNARNGTSRFFWTFNLQELDHNPVQRLYLEKLPHTPAQQYFPSNDLALVSSARFQAHPQTLTPQDLPPHLGIPSVVFEILPLIPKSDRNAEEGA